MSPLLLFTGAAASNPEVAFPEVIHPLPHVIAPVEAVRGTIICSSIIGLREAGLEPSYRRYLSPALRSVIDELSPSSWIPIRIAEAHYRACDRIGLSDDVVENLFDGANERLRGTTLSTLAAAARALGATPLLPLRSYNRIWERLYQGGGSGVTRLTHDTARVEGRGVSLLAIPYYALGFQYLHQRACRLFSKEARVSSVRAPDSHSFAFHVSWK